jgi:radical SAM superfamily enzyme YgiQ (UPF0313 family)
MNILILDPYPDRPWRISKDTIGGYGTANRFGDGLVSRAITWVMAREVDWPPLYAVHTAGVLTAQGHDVEYARHFDSAKTYDFCLTTSSIVSHETELAAVQNVNAHGIPVGVIGPFATTIPSPYLNAGGFVISGEPEMYFLNHLLVPENLDALSGIIESGNPISLDDLPLPAWEMVFKTAKPKFGLLGGKHVMLPIAATRGCPYSCFNYCVYPLQQGRKVRMRDPQKIVEEMEHWADTLGVTFYIFRDPVFSINREHTMKICDALEKSNHKFKFVIETHLNNMDVELATRLQKLGLEMVKVGVESISPETIKESKRFTIEHDQQVERIKMLEKLGIKITCFYILGMPGDTPDAFHATMDYARQLNSVFAQISVFTPYPGTPAFGQFKDKIIADKYEDFTQYDLVIKHDALNPAQVRKILSKAYRKYYLRPRWVFKYLAARFT